MTEFGRVSLDHNNMGALTPPGIGNDNTQGYNVGSWWFDNTEGVMWRALSVATGAAVWFPITGNIIGAIIGANMNSANDQQFVGHVPAGKGFLINKIAVNYGANTPVSLTTAAGGVYSAASKGGTTIVAASQTYTGLSGTASQNLVLTLAAAATTSIFTSMPFFSLTTAQGAAALANVYLFGDLMTLG